jgi:phosphoglycerol geranylgeranyltransferase
MLLQESLYGSLRTQKKLLFVLVDPDQYSKEIFAQVLGKDNSNSIDAILVGGSLITHGSISKVICKIKEQTALPVCIFPGNYMQVDDRADAILFLSLISGRNADLLIGNQVIAAPFVKKSKLEVIPTGYMLIDGGKTTTAHYMSNTAPIPARKPEIAACTALAGEMLGLACVFMDAGSGAAETVSPLMIRAVYETVQIPIIVGGGIRNAQQASDMYEAGATAIVIGNAAEENPNLIQEICHIKNQLNAD